MGSYSRNIRINKYRNGCSFFISTAYNYSFSVAALILAATFIFAVPNSALAQDSVDSEVSITKGEAIRISNIDDWLIGVFTATSTINNWQYQWDYQCVYSTSGAYSVEITSQNGLTPLALISGAGDQMEYDIYSFYRRGVNYNLDGPYDTATFSLTNLSASQSPTCADENYGGANLFFAAVVKPAGFNAAPPGIYQDLVTLQVVPE